jgi:hypothetical protein
VPDAADAVDDQRNRQEELHSCEILQPNIQQQQKKVLL